MLSFDGNVTRVDSADVDLGTAISIVAFFRTDHRGETGATPSFILGYGVGNENNSSVRYALMMAAANAPYNVDAWAFMSGHAVTSGKWSTPTNSAKATWGLYGSVGVAYDGGSTANDPRFYRNGQLITPVTEHLAPSGALGGTMPDPIHVGNNGGGARGFAALFQSIAVWTRALAPEEFARIHQCGLRAAPKGQFLHWEFAHTTTAVKDLTGQGQVGTLTLGTATWDPTLYNRSSVGGVSR